MVIVVNHLFKEFVRKSGKPYNLEQFMERMTIRVPGEKPSAESFHRDESKVASGDDKMFGEYYVIVLLIFFHVLKLHTSFTNLFSPM